MIKTEKIMILQSASRQKYPKVKDLHQSSRGKAIRRVVKPGSEIYMVKGNNGIIIDGKTAYFVDEDDGETKGVELTPETVYQVSISKMNNPYMDPRWITTEEVQDDEMARLVKCFIIPPKDEKPSPEKKPAKAAKKPAKAAKKPSKPKKAVDDTPKEETAPQEPSQEQVEALEQLASDAMSIED